MFLISEGVLQDHDLNPFTKSPHTPQYKKILEARKKLPVFAQMDEFLEMVRSTVLLGMRRGLSSAILGTHPPPRRGARLYSLPKSEHVNEY